MDEGMLTVIDLFNITQLIAMVPSTRDLICEWIINYIDVKGYTVDSICEKLGPEEATLFVTVLLKHAPEIKDQSFLRLAEKILRNYNSVSHLTALDTYFIITKCKHFETTVQKELAAIFFGKQMKWREQTYLKYFKTSYAFGKAKVDRNNSAIWDGMFRVDVKHIEEDVDEE